jgi:uncharacterized membrane protein
VVFVAVAVFVTRDVVLDRFFDWANDRFAGVDATTAPGVVAPTSATVSGSPASLAPWATLGEYGRSFVATATTRADLRAFHGPEGEVLDPIRVYAGLRSAGSADERAALAVRELERTGAFDREVLGVVTTTGTGWVDPNAASSLEYLYRGDTALVGLQYSYLPSWISFLVDRDEAAEAGVALYEHVHRRWAELPAATRPRLVIFGESLGSFGAEAAFRGGDGAASLANLVDGSDGALFTGPTASNHIWDQLTDGREPAPPSGARSTTAAPRSSSPTGPPTWNGPTRPGGIPASCTCTIPRTRWGTRPSRRSGGGRNGPTGPRATTSPRGPAGTRSSPASRRWPTSSPGSAPPPGTGTTTASTS